MALGNSVEDSSLFRILSNGATIFGDEQSPRDLRTVVRLFGSHLLSP